MYRQLKGNSPVWFPPYESHHRLNRVAKPTHIRKFINPIVVLTVLFNWFDLLG